MAWAGVRWVAPDRIDTYIPADGVKVTSYFDGTPSQGSLYVDSYLEVKDKYSIIKMQLIPSLLMLVFQIIYMCMMVNA